ncbi:MAG: YcgN family cysteine cluster protein [Rhodospirillales bacterium]|nr:YcgN family cysteine cluster protein [Rhodospirillales bacterium]
MNSVADREIPFWREKTLAEMTRDEWESLCDGCGKCCLGKVDDPKTGALRQTDVACRLLDPDTCRCSSYADRKRFVPDCVVLTPAKVATLSWLPGTCAYRLVAAGRDLYAWHPLVSGDSESVHRAGISVRGRMVSERECARPEERIVEWPA